MKLKKVRLKNFRGYLDTTFSVDKLNVIIGKNDVGKSTVIDALDVYFNDASIEPSDLNVYADPSETGSIEISCSFEVDPDERITLDSCENTATTLKAEYLLNKENLLEISKKYECSNGRIKKPVVQIVARHPKNFEKALICLKIQDLLKLANNKNISVPNRNVKKEIRRAIFEQYPNIEWVDDFLISIDSKDGDIIPVFSKFKDDFPAFLIFRADRTNTDKDKEVNDTTKAIAKAAVAELESKFSEIKKIVIEQIQALADKTLLKLNEFDEHIAKELKTNIETKTLDSLFSFTFNCEDGISFNKRGSGIKRLMLLSFFLAEAERKNISKNIIYAIEEPETSQHPDFQIMLMNALKDLSDSGNRQILLTTHTPEIVKMINKEDLIFIQKDHENHMISVETNDDIEISKVADTLGILPFVSYKGVIFVEGKTDIRFLKNLSKIDEFRSIIDLTHFTFIELHGGGNIDLWIKANYLSGTNIKCLYFRDRDTSTTPPSVVHPQKVIITSKREIENYIPISSIEEKFDVTFTPYEIEHWNDMDVANSLYNKGIRFGNDQKHSENVIKQILQGQNIWNQIILSPENRSEIQDWFQQMKDFFEDAGW